MFEKVNPSHPDKIADRIAGAMVDLAYREQQAPKVAIEVLIGHRQCNIICESSYQFNKKDVKSIVKRIANIDKVNLLCVKQDYALAQNQKDKLRCGDNGIFKGAPITLEQKRLSNIARDIYSKYPYDGKYILSHGQLIICQSNATFDEINSDYKDAIINPLGFWTGGLKTDSGATNRKLGSDMGDAVTGGGLHGKDLSKADVSVKPDCATEENGFWCLANYDRFKGGRKANVEVHGGASLEEVAVPIVEITKVGKAIECSVCADSKVVTVSFKKKAELRLFVAEDSENVAIAIGGKIYQAEKTESKFYYKIPLPDIKKVGNYDFEVHVNGNVIKRGLSFEVKKEGATERKFF